MSVARRSGMELLEESADLLRRAPASAWVWYLGGAIPFFSAFLIFHAKMTGTTAVPDPILWSLAIAILFGWRQYSRAWFAGQLNALLSGSPPARHALSTLAVAWFAGIARLPLFVLPFPAIVALFRNVAVIAPRAETPGVALSRAGSLATRGSSQFPALLTLALVLFVVWINVLTGMLVAPLLFQMFTGQQTLLSTNMQALLNDTILFASAAVAWCLIDVVLVAFYALRVFYGESEETGADLLAGWRRAVSKTIVRGSIVLLILMSPALHAAAPAKSADLKTAIHQVLTEQPYQWREPLPAAKDQNAFVRWTDNLLHSVRRFWEAVKRGWAWFIDSLSNLGGSRSLKDSNAAPPAASLRALSWLVIIVLIGALVALLLRSRRQRKHPASGMGLPAGPLPIDLEDPSLLASRLPENEWVAMARDFLARGDFRMALRAYFLASLAFLASREMVAIARSKTNLDYLGEVRRRARSVAGLDALFAGGIRNFESAWYGLHDVSDADVHSFAENLERMRGLVV